MRAQFVFHEVWIGLRRNLTMTVALIVVVAISLSLLGTGLLFVKQVDNTRTYWQTKVQLAVWLCSSQDLSGNCAKEWRGHIRRDQHDQAGPAGQSHGGQRSVSLGAAELPDVQAGVQERCADDQLHPGESDPRLVRGAAEERRG